MRQVRWAGWTMALVTALALSGAAARADIASDKPAAIVVYPKIVSNTTEGLDTVVRISNTNQNEGRLLHCFYLDANSHCSGGSAEGKICTGDPTVCVQGGVCLPSWQEVDFRVRLTPGQPIEWKASDGLLDGRTCEGGSNKGKACRLDSDCPSSRCLLGITITAGVCERNPFRTCGSDADCNPFPGGDCTPSNSGTRVPGVPEDPFVGELKCIVIDENGVPAPHNDIKGEALIETSKTTHLDVASYNAIGIQATGISSGAPNELQIGGDAETAEYNGCPNFLILDHFFDQAMDPVPGTNNTITTNLVFVPCSEDLLRQIPGSAVVQYLVFNEFEQRFSTSRSVKCFEDIQLCNIDTRDCTRSIFNVNVSGTLTGQTRMNPIGVPMPPPFPGIPSGLLAIAIETHQGTAVSKSAGFNLQKQGARNSADTWTIP